MRVAPLVGGRYSRGGLLLLIVLSVILVALLALHPLTQSQTRRTPPAGIVPLSRRGTQLGASDATTVRPEDGGDSQTPLLPSSKEAVDEFIVLRRIFGQEEFDPRDAIPHMIAIIRMARGATDDSIAASLVGAYFDSSTPVALRYVIPALLLPMPGGEGFLKELTTRVREAEPVAAYGLLAAFTHIGGRARALWESDRFWTGYFIADSGEFGVHFYDRLQRENGPPNGSALPQDSGPMSLHADGMVSVDTLGYRESTNWRLPDEVLGWISTGFRGETRVDVVNRLMFLLGDGQPSPATIGVVVSFYQQAAQADLKFEALAALVAVDSAVVEPVYKDALHDAPSAKFAELAVSSPFVISSRDPSLVDPILQCYAKYKGDLELANVVESLARKESSTAYDFLDRAFESAPDLVLDGIPSDLPESVVTRAKSLLDRGARSSNITTRSKAYEASIRAFPDEREAVLQRVAVTETDEGLRQWAMDQMKNR